MIKDAKFISIFKVISEIMTLNQGQSLYN